ncbi:60S ribosomal protein L4 [Salvia divinorum]|uniref:Large ribosomal subunit protein uL4c n=1 Tax=Salvia divinorum TaxID=28513 RepID=A0ABD1IBE6_SALDI
MATAAPSSISFFSSSIFLSNPSPSPKTIHFPRRRPSSAAAKIQAELATVPILSFDGDQVGSATLNLKSAPPETARAVVHRGITTDLTNRRRGTASTLTRAEVRGGGAKPYPQKKTGRARRGSQRTPLRPGGGVIFGPKPKDWSIKINRKEKRLAISTAIASALGNAIVVEDFEDKFEKPKTKEFIALMKRLGLDPKRKSMFLMTEVSDNVRLSSRNLGTLKMLTPRTLNLFDILDAESLVLSKGAVDFLNERYGLDGDGDDEENEFEEGEEEDDSQQGAEAEVEGGTDSSE